MLCTPCITNRAGTHLANHKAVATVAAPNRVSLIKQLLATGPGEVISIRARKAVETSQLTPKI